MNKITAHLICWAGCAGMFASPAFSEPMQLGTPPAFPPASLPKEKTDNQTLTAPVTIQALSVNPQSLQASRDFYYSHYVGSEGAAMNWTGDHASCNAGTTSQAYKDARLLEIQYFRAMAGVPAEVTFDSGYNAKAQQAALMMSVNGQLSHSPPASWTCYTADGAEAAGKSNLMMGYTSHHIAGYMKDSGSGNSAVGHRRWVIYPQTQLMGTGDVPAAAPTYTWATNALWVFDSHMWEPRPATREEYVAWPPPGYVPYQVVYPRWSFAYADADFGSATVTMTKDGSPISLTKETYDQGYGENTLVWRPFGMANGGTWPQEHLVTYNVTVSNVVISGNARSFTYTVTVFDPAALPSGPEIAIKGNGITIADGDTTPNSTDHTVFAKTSVGTPVSRTYTIANTGDQDLNLTGSPLVNLTGAGCAEFSVTQQPTTPVAAGETTTFTVQYNPTDTSSDTCSVSVDNNDSNENPYNFDIKGIEGIEQGADWLPAIYRLLRQH